MGWMTDGTYETVADVIEIVLTERLERGGA